jgi:hypothetical protein
MPILPFEEETIKNAIENIVSDMTGEGVSEPNRLVDCGQLLAYLSVVGYIPSKTSTKQLRGIVRYKKLFGVFNMDCRETLPEAMIRHSNNYIKGRSIVLEDKII